MVYKPDVDHKGKKARRRRKLAREGVDITKRPLKAEIRFILNPQPQQQEKS